MLLRPFSYLHTRFCRGTTPWFKVNNLCQPVLCKRSSKRLTRGMSIPSALPPFPRGRGSGALSPFVPFAGQCPGLWGRGGRDPSGEQQSVAIGAGGVAV